MTPAEQLAAKFKRKPAIPSESNGLVCNLALIRKSTGLRSRFRATELSRFPKMAGSWLPASKKAAAAVCGSCQLPEEKYACSSEPSRAQSRDGVESIGRRMAATSCSIGLQEQESRIHMRIPLASGESPLMAASPKKFSTPENP